MATRREPNVFVTQAKIELIQEEHDDPGREFLVVRVEGDNRQLLEFWAHPKTAAHRFVRAIEQALKTPADVSRWARNQEGQRWILGGAVHPFADGPPPACCISGNPPAYTHVRITDGTVNSDRDILLQCWNIPEPESVRFAAAFIEAWFGAKFVDKQLAIRSEWQRKKDALPQQNLAFYFEGLFSRDVQ